MPDFSFLIPSRNEQFLARTIENILANIRGDSEIIAILDGAWADPPIPDHPRVRLIHLPTPIGQRAATNLAARLSTARYVCKLDAHCAIDEGFDVKMMQAGEECGHDTTMIPAMNNLHGFSWRCTACGTETYQGPDLTICATCQKPGPFERVMYWDLNAGGVPGKPRRTEAWRFDSDLHFQYGGPRRKGEEKAEIADVMSSVGACFVMRRSRFEQLGGLDELYGSWGGMGTEVSCKSWLSGGRQVVVKRTYYAHLFRTQGAGFSFPYVMRGSDQERAKEYGRKLWLHNAWAKQVRPLSWLIDHFAPIRGWQQPESHGETADQRKMRETRLAEVKSAGAAFVLRQQAVLTLPHSGACQTLTPAPAGKSRDAHGQLVPTDTDRLSCMDGGRSIPAQDVFGNRSETQVSRVAAYGPVALVVEDLATLHARHTLDEPCVENAIHAHHISATGREPKFAVSSMGIPGPDPAASLAVDDDLREDARERLAVEVGNGKILSSHVSASRVDMRSGAAGVEAPAVPFSLPSLGLLYYSDGCGDARILSAVRQQILRAAPLRLPLVSVTLQPLDFGRSIALTMLPRGPLTMFRQILVGLEALQTDYVFFVEHDVLYSPEHFQFIPPTRDRFYYNSHRWQVSAETGQAAHYLCCQTAQLCASRALLIVHYEKRIAAVEAAGGYSREMGYEPGTNRWARGLDGVGHEVWHSAIPNIDIRHSGNLSKTRWSPAEFRNKSTCLGWVDADAVPGWGVTRGRFQAFLADLERTATATAGAA